MNTAHATLNHNTVVAERDELVRIFELQKSNQQKIADSTVKERKQKLKLLLQTILKYRKEIQEALYKDFKKHPLEVDIAEIYKITS